ncbi:MAG: 16S rRNA (adenine(1518)-N(6)/adenine(1519)-N(6))-dimethyltransferase, partial [Candidatus Eremiobacteraeota bacterium]|nr:16S rRNA (adenine(1518)-N(6)/adenine(1519)-N(6))-dimethyltransferase [Candidatus Eremiobacteraeota bacterium]
RDLVEILRSREELSCVEVVEADALAFDFGAWSCGAPWIAAGNLPYNIATPLLMRWIESQGGPQRIVAMIQRDVADRLVAAPNSPAYGSLSLAVQFAADVRRAFVLGPRSFFPQPKVESAVVVLERRAQPAVAVRDHAFFRQVVRGAFAYRRKTLANSLALALPLERSAVTAALARLGLDTEIRGEQLDLAGFAALADALGA